MKGYASLDLLLATLIRHSSRSGKDLSISYPPIIMGYIEMLCPLGLITIPLHLPSMGRAEILIVLWEAHSLLWKPCCVFLSSKKRMANSHLPLCVVGAQGNLKRRVVMIICEAMKR